eukprot:TRINITY_DN18312_c0_g1_i1.p2 TRINITY_DN18312_c0_g1~~TRINITY_DN18312_c0_g1_i1.p2  ORF type:complete len:327 (-),score=68.14 TRINITY_DN18312_c0_g1_i1:33-1013(-)
MASLANDNGCAKCGTTGYCGGAQRAWLLMPAHLKTQELLKHGKISVIDSKTANRCATPVVQRLYKPPASNKPKYMTKATMNIQARMTTLLTTCEQTGSEQEQTPSRLPSHQRIPSKAASAAGTAVSRDELLDRTPTAFPEFLGNKLHQDKDGPQASAEGQIEAAMSPEEAASAEELQANAWWARLSHPRPLLRPEEISYLPSLTRFRKEAVEERVLRHKCRREAEDFATCSNCGQMQHGREHRVMTCASCESDICSVCLPHALCDHVLKEWSDMSEEEQLHRMFDERKISALDYRTQLRCLTPVFERVGSPSPDGRKSVVERGSGR